jgi:hypothetical protein
MACEWFRLYRGTCKNPKLHLIAATTGAAATEVLTTWLCVLEYASQATPRGSLVGLNPRHMAVAFLFPEQLREHDVFEAQVERIKAILQALRDEGLITGDTVTNWDKRQYQGADETATQRKRNQRERERHSRSRSLTVTLPLAA